MSGTVYFITGLSGAGKTTLGNMLYDELRKNETAVIRWDGDTVRDALCEPYDGKFDVESRFLGSMRDARMIVFLAEQGMDVVVSVISLFEQIRRFYRSKVKNYIEIFIDCPIDVLKTRDIKGLYKGALEGKIKDVVGVDILAEYPCKPDVYISNDGVLTVDEMFISLMNQLKEIKNMMRD